MGWVVSEVRYDGVAIDQGRFRLAIWIVKPKLPTGNGLDESHFTLVPPVLYPVQ